MGKFARGKQEFHNIYLEFNSIRERMLSHKERSGASAVSNIRAAVMAAAMSVTPALVLVVALTCLLLLQSFTLTSDVKSVTPTTAKVEVVSDVSFSNVEYPIYFRLYPVTEILTPKGEEMDPSLPLEERYSLGEPAIEGEINENSAELEFKELTESRKRSRMRTETIHHSLAAQSGLSARTVCPTAAGTARR